MNLRNQLMRLNLLPKPQSVRDELTEIITTSVNSAPDFDNHEEALLRNMLGLKDITAEDLMVPRADIISVDLTDGFDAALQRISTANHTRVPAHKGNKDQILGMLHIKDLMAHLVAGKRPDLASLLRPVLYVAPTIRLLDLLHEMRLRRHHMALVVDEFGGVDGLITIEDMIEEIVGDIADEHDETTPPRFEISEDGTAIADARLEIEELERLSGPLLAEDERDEIDTLGGLVSQLAGRVPTCGEVIRHPGGLEFEVLEGDPRRITLLKIDGMSRLPSQQSDTKKDKSKKDSAKKSTRQKTDSKKSDSGANSGTT